MVLAVMSCLAVACSSENTSPASESTSGSTTSSALSYSDLDLEAVASELTEEYGCGYSVAVGSRDGTAGLFFTFDSGAGARGVLPEDTTLPDSRWHGQLRVGEHLFANWCADEVFESSAAIEARRPVVGGRIEVSFPAGSGECQETDINLVGVTIEDRDGSTVTVPDARPTVAWGCFPHMGYGP